MYIHLCVCVNMSYRFKDLRRSCHWQGRFVAESRFSSTQEVNALQEALADQKKMLEERTLSVDVVAIADGRTKHAIYDNYQLEPHKAVAEVSK